MSDRQIIEHAEAEMARIDGAIALSRQTLINLEEAKAFQEKLLMRIRVYALCGRTVPASEDANTGGRDESVVQTSVVADTAAAPSSDRPADLIAETMPTSGDAGLRADADALGSDVEPVAPIPDTREGAPAGAAERNHSDPLWSGAATREDAVPAAPVPNTENAAPLRPQAGEVPPASPAPKRQTLFEAVAEIHQRHPDWSATQIAKFTGRPHSSVTSTLTHVKRRIREGRPLVDEKVAPSSVDGMWGLDEDARRRAIAARASKGAREALKAVVVEREAQRA